MKRSFAVLLMLGLLFGALPVQAKITAYIIQVAPRGYFGETEIEGHYAELAKYISYRLTEEIMLELVPYQRAQLTLQQDTRSFSIMAESQRILENAKSAGELGSLQVGVLFHPAIGKRCPVLTDSNADLFLGRVLGTNLMPSLDGNAQLKIIELEDTRSLLRMYATGRLDGIVGMIHHWEHNWPELDPDTRAQLRKGDFCHYADRPIHVWTGHDVDPDLFSKLEIASNLLRQSDVFSQIMDPPLEDLNVIQSWTKAF